MNVREARARIENQGLAKTLLPDEPMSAHTTFKIGGPADLLCVPDGEEGLRGILSVCRETETPFFLMGNGSNLLVSDLGIRGVVIKTQDGLADIIVESDAVVCGSGVLLSRVAVAAMRHSLTGLEFAHGIPGTAGGAVFMNAGAYGGEMKDVVNETRWMDGNGKVHTLSAGEHGFGYRRSVFSANGGMILSTRFSLQKGDEDAIRGRMEELSRLRREKQPMEMPSAGSVFKRPEGYFAGKLIDDCGLRGHRIGGAQVSGKHCGFIVNTGGATADDVLRLIEHIQSEVQKGFGVTLECEVRRVGG